MSKSRRKDYYDDNFKIRHNEKDVNKSRKHRNNLYKYSSNHEEDDYDDYDTAQKY